MDELVVPNESRKIRKNPNSWINRGEIEWTWIWSCTNIWDCMNVKTEWDRNRKLWREWNERNYEERFKGFLTERPVEEQINKEDGWGWGWGWGLHLQGTKHFYVPNLPLLLTKITWCHLPKSFVEVEKETNSWWSRKPNQTK